jgi:hypothetical protein
VFTIQGKVSAKVWGDIPFTRNEPGNASVRTGFGGGKGGPGVVVVGTGFGGNSYGTVAFDSTDDAVKISWASMPKKRGSEPGVDARSAETAEEAMAAIAALQSQLADANEHLAAGVESVAHASRILRSVNAAIANRMAQAQHD